MKSVRDHFRGTLKNVDWVTGKTRRSSKSRVDLRTMAFRAMNYFLRTPRPHLNYACRFGVSLSACPPGPEGEDLVAHGDTDIRMESALPGLRKISRRTDGLEVDQGLYRRIMGYVGKDHLSLVSCAALCAKDVSAELNMVSLGTTSQTIRSLTEHWIYSGEKAFLIKAKKMAGAMKKIAWWDTGRAYYPGGGFLNGKWIGGGFGAKVTFYTTVVNDLIHYGTYAGDEEIIEFAYHLARGVVADLPPESGPFSLADRRFCPDGSFTDHTHLHTRTVWGVAMAGRVMRDPVLIEWARRAYEFVRSCGTDFGWFPERTILPGRHPFDGYEDRVDVSETCVTGDMVQTAIELARAGYPHYWDHVERYLKNYIHEVQFVLTPEIEKFYRKINADNPRLEEGLKILHDFDGGFISDISVNDWSSPTFGLMPMAGCCVPEGARAILMVWRNIVEREGKNVKVNMIFDYDGEDCRIEEKWNGTRITPTRSMTPLVRPPAWTDRNSVRIKSKDSSIKPQWSGDYLALPLLQKNVPIELTWKVPTFTQQVEAGGRIGHKHLYSLTWQGNRVLRIEPGGKKFPIFK
jgi:hypothetical protein